VGIGLGVVTRGVEGDQLTDVERTGERTFSHERAHADTRAHGGCLHDEQPAA
jgi:hypothetical protein